MATLRENCLPCFAGCEGYNYCILTTTNCDKQVNDIYLVIVDSLLESKTDSPCVSLGYVIRVSKKAYTSTNVHGHC